MLLLLTCHGQQPKVAGGVGSAGRAGRTRSARHEQIRVARQLSDQAPDGEDAASDAAQLKEKAACRGGFSRTGGVSENQRARSVCMSRALVQ
jgi:hypothetical protein